MRRASAFSQSLVDRAAACPVAIVEIAEHLAGGVADDETLGML
jgi:hypothetical protein